MHERMVLMNFSVIIPARNEEKYISECLTAVKRAEGTNNCNVEIIVVLNRCTLHSAVVTC